MLADPEGISSGSVEALALPELEALNFGRFVTSAACALCHSNHFAASAMRGSEGEDLGPFNLWQGTMMANASRDPFWWAQASSESAMASPEKRASVEGACVHTGPFY